MKDIIISLILILFTACVSIKPANNINKAENKIIKFNDGIKNQIDKYPSLANKAWKVIVKDTVYIPIDSSNFTLQLIKVDSLLSVSQNYLKKINKRQIFIDSLINVPLKDYPKECEYIVEDLSKRINKLYILSKQYQEESIKWHSNYISAITTTIVGAYSDDKFIVDYFYYNGQIDIKVKTQDRYIVVDKEEHFYDVNIRKHFWQDTKFYVFLLMLLSLFYFFPTIIGNVINIIIKFFRKIIGV